MRGRDAHGDHPVVFRLLPVSRPSIGEAVSLLEAIVGVIGVILIVYLLATVLWPERF
jgi:K+-transporting ATPase KdpF subunit